MGRTPALPTAAMVLVALAWIPVIKGAQGLYTYLQAVQGYLAPPIFVVFFLGVFFKRMNSQGALWAMIVGFVLPMLRIGGSNINNNDFSLSGLLVAFVGAVILLAIYNLATRGRVR